MDKTTVSTPKWLRILGSVFFIYWLGVVVVSGFAWPLGLYQYSRWPWNQSWFMFYQNAGSHYCLQVSGTTVDGKKANVSLDDYFRYPAAYNSSRANELGRDVGIMRRLAGYVCYRYNKKAPPSAKLKHLTLWDSWWPDTAGYRRTASEVPEAQKQHWTYVQNETCESLEQEWIRWM